MKYAVDISNFLEEITIIKWLQFKVFNHNKLRASPHLLWRGELFYRKRKNLRAQCCVFFFFLSTLEELKVWRNSGSSLADMCDSDNLLFGDSCQAKRGNLYSSCWSLLSKGLKTSLSVLLIKFKLRVLFVILYSFPTRSGSFSERITV